MKAMVYTQYGSPDVLQLEEIEQPTPKDDEVLIEVRAASVNRSDWEGLIGKPLYVRIAGLRTPRNQILGSDIAGRVVAVGPSVSTLQPGDEVFGLLSGYRGGFAEYVCAREGAMALKPASMTFDEVATIPQAGVIALQGIRDKGQVQAGQQVLINGAGGGAGVFAVQLAKLYGAEVTGVDNSGKLEFMRSLGADHVIDYRQEDFTKREEQYDLVLDLIAGRSIFALKRALRPNGRYYFVGGSVFTLLQILTLGPVLRRTTGSNLRLLAIRPNVGDMVHMAELCAADNVVPVIDRRYPLREVPDALRYLGAGDAKGKLVITLDHDDSVAQCAATAR